MSWIVATLVLALLVPLVTRGSYARLLQTRWRWTSLLLLGLAIQIALEVIDIPETRWHTVGFGLLVASYVLLLGFCGANVVHRGMGVVLIGVALNTVAIAANQGMPVDVPEQWLDDRPIEETIKHHPQGSDDVLIPITDIVPVPGPWPTVVSFGDLIMTVGLIDVVFHASRRTRRRVRRKDRDAHDRATDESAWPTPTAKGFEPRDDTIGSIALPTQDAEPVNDLLFGEVPDSAGRRGELLVGDEPTKSIDDATVVEVPRR